MKPLFSSPPPPLFWESESRCSCCLPCAVFLMLPSLPWVPKGCRVLLFIFCKYLKGMMVYPKLPWVRPHPAYDGVEQRFVTAKLWQEMSDGITPVLVSRRDWGKQVGWILPFESTWNDQAVFFSNLGNCISGYIFRISVFRKFGDKKREQCVSVAATSHLRLFRLA